MEVRDAPDLTPEEKEVTLTGTKADDEFIVHSDIGSVSRWLLNHPYTTITETREQDGVIVGVRARIPKGCVKLQANNRESQTFGAITSPLSKSGESE